MSIARTWVFPILRLVIFAAIAIALVKVAFFADSTDAAANPDVPSAVIVEPQVAVTTDTIRNNVTMDALVSPKAAVPVPATLAGEVKAVYVAKGDNVVAGQSMLTLSIEEPIPGNKKGKTREKTSVVVAPVAGTVSSFTALVGQSFAVGDPVGQVAPPSFVVSGTLAPDQLYRLVDKPKKAKVTITGGPAPFTCKHLTITTPLAGDTDEADAAAGPTVTCTVPKKIKVFAGLSAKMTIAGGVAKDVLTVPVTAVEGATSTGNVYVLLDDGTSEAKPVELGLNDGKIVEITDGLAEGDMILQFVPGADAVCDENGNCGGQG
jgi:multidrug efflux pump subunit AcrA (membrane-fusion protein)